jgi:hypothetical protein
VIVWKGDMAFFAWRRDLEGISDQAAESSASAKPLRLTNICGASRCRPCTHSCPSRLGRSQAKGTSDWGPR